MNFESEVDSPESNFMLRPTTFSVQTCYELVKDGKLGLEQITRESKLLLHPELLKDVPTVRVTRSMSSQSGTPESNPHPLPWLLVKI